MCVSSSIVKVNASMGPILNISYRRDPTRTSVLRDKFSGQMTKRFSRIRGLIWTSIVTEDVFGLRGDETVLNQRIKINQTPGRRAFAFTTSSQKVSAFMQWLQRQVRAEILDVANIDQVGTGVNAAWTNLYVQDSYRRGVTRARNQMRQVGYRVPTISESGGIGLVANVPIHLDRLGLLYTRVFNDLKGITDAMDTQISRVLTQGIADGVNANTLGKQLNAVIRGGGGDLGITDILGRYIPAERRARMLARTEIIRAHAEGQLQEFENWKVEGVNVDAEWVTAGDNRVCERCASLQGNVYSIKEARGKLPLHPQCRCAWIPTSPN